MSKEKPAKAIENLKEVEHALTTAELFFEKNARLVSIIFGAAVVVALLFLAVHRFYTIPHETKAKEQIFTAEQYFEKDSFNLALNGDGNYPGVLDIIDNYGRTPAETLQNIMLVSLTCTWANTRRPSITLKVSKPAIYF